MQTRTRSLIKAFYIDLSLTVQMGICEEVHIYRQSFLQRDYWGQFLKRFSNLREKFAPR
jgi:hypothetical protein